MMKAVIAEKPSVAREIAALLGAHVKREGYLTGNGFEVTWALGHLVGLGMPEDYGISGFQRSSLPILPNPFQLTIRKIRKDKGYKIDVRALKQLKIIKQIFDRCDSIIVATDAGREGELIFRYIYEYLECEKPFERLWISSLTEKAIKQGFDNLKPGESFTGLYLSGKARSRADWLVGINGSQALSLSAGNGVYSLGRVQTPTLALICKRYQESKEFSVQKYWQIQLEHRKEFMDFKSLSKCKWDDKKQSERALKSIQKTCVATITAVECKAVTEQPPLLYDLTTLQKEVNKKLGLSAEETLNVAQGLYEKQFITYPRTGSKYLPQDLWAEIPSLVRALDDRPTCKEAAGKVKWGSFNKRIINNVKVTDHHGLLITGKIPSALLAKENAIYDMIALRLLEAISHPCSKEITDVTLQALQFDFGLKGCKILEPGWRVIRGSFSDEQNTPVQILPELEVDDELKIKMASLMEKKTKPPKLFTEADLLSALENAGKEIKDEEKRKILQTIGIGTPATRAAIIEVLLRRGYIIREKKCLMPTDKGLQVYHLVKSKKIANVAMTAEWERALHNIEIGEQDANAFQHEMEDLATSITKELLAAAIISEQLPKLTCPKCRKQQLLIRDLIVKCPDESCNWAQFRRICGVQLGIDEIKRLIVEGRTTLIKGMQSKSGKRFDAYIVRGDEGKTHFEFNKNSFR